MKKVQSLRNAVMVSLLAGTTVVWGGHSVCTGGFAGVRVGGYGGNCQPCSDTEG